ncbi:MAG: polysaccharide pyruvyl transferase family protein [Anaerolineae bacterium]|nr:polysaccharide pyruvyl transferase family protein [Anaerolineae bacterium]
MRISNIQTTQHDDYCELSALISSTLTEQPFKVWVRVPTQFAHFFDVKNGDPFLIMCLLPAMRLNESLEIDVPVCERLLTNIENLQQIYRRWDVTLQPVTITAPSRSHTHLSPQPNGIGLFFSLGVDSYYSLLRNVQAYPSGDRAITHLIMVRGLDIQDEVNDSVWPDVLRMGTRAASETNKTLIPIDTNVRQWSNQILDLDWGKFYHGAALALVGLSLSNGFKHIHIASSRLSADYDMPGGSHPVINTLLSSAGMTFDYDGGETSRKEKIRFISHFPLAMQTLRVCFSNPNNAYNCGKCGKCQETLFHLELVGASEKCETFPVPVNIPALGPKNHFSVRNWNRELASLGNSSKERDIASVIEAFLPLKPHEQNAHVIQYFVSKQTLEQIQHADHIVMLLGSYSGYINFGDILQLQSAIQFHQQRNPNCLIMPLLNITAIPHTNGIQRMVKATGVETCLFFSQVHHDDIHNETRSHFLSTYCEMRPLMLEHIQPPTLHVYGGGFFNERWGEQHLRLVEHIIDQSGVGHYVISGQQVSESFAARLAAHIAEYQPELVGCRDQQSASYLKEYGINAIWSSDDAIDLLISNEGNANPTQPIRIGVHINSSGYTQENNIDDQTAQAFVVSQLQILAQYADENHAIPVLVNLYSDAKQNAIDTWGNLASAPLSHFFPHFQGLDMGEMLVANHLPQALNLLSTLHFVVTNSYHLALCCQMLGVPVYLAANNAYYRQKHAGLELSSISLADFLGANKSVIAKEQSAWRYDAIVARRDWLSQLAYALSQTSTTTYHRPTSRAYLERQWKNWQAVAQRQALLRDQAKQSLHAVSSERDNLWIEVQRLNKVVREQQAKLTSLQTVKA